MPRIPGNVSSGAVDELNVSGANLSSDQLQEIRLGPKLKAEFDLIPFNPDAINEYRGEPAIEYAEVDGRGYWLHDTNNFAMLLENYFTVWRFRRFGNRGVGLSRISPRSLKNNFRQDGFSRVMNTLGRRYPHLCESLKDEVMQLKLLREAHNTADKYDRERALAKLALKTPEDTKITKLVLSKAYEAAIMIAKERGLGKVDQQYLSVSGYPSGSLASVFQPEKDNQDLFAGRTEAEKREWWQNNNLANNLDLLFKLRHNQLNPEAPLPLENSYEQFTLGQFSDEQAQSALQLLEMTDQTLFHELLSFWQEKQRYQQLKKAGNDYRPTAEEKMFLAEYEARLDDAERIYRNRRYGQALSILSQVIPKEALVV